MKVDDTITFNCEIIGDSGLILFKSGQQVVVRDVDMAAEYYGRGSGIFYPEEVLGIKLEDHYGVFRPDCFYENNIDCKVIKVSIRDRKITKKKFKSGELINTIKGVTIHPKLKIPAYTFHEDESYVECRRCELTHNLTIHQMEILRQYSIDNNIVIVTVEQGLGKSK